MARRDLYGVHARQRREALLDNRDLRRAADAVDEQRLTKVNSRTNPPTYPLSLLKVDEFVRELTFTKRLYEWRGETCTVSTPASGARHFLTIGISEAQQMPSTSSVVTLAEEAAVGGSTTTSTSAT